MKTKCLQLKHEYQRSTSTRQVYISSLGKTLSNLRPVVINSIIFSTNMIEWTFLLKPVANEVYTHQTCFHV